MSTALLTTPTHLTSTYAAGSKHSIAPPKSFRRVAPEDSLAAAIAATRFRSIVVYLSIYRGETHTGEDGAAVQSLGSSCVDSGQSGGHKTTAIVG